MKTILILLFCLIGAVCYAGIEDNSTPEAFPQYLYKITTAQLWRDSDHQVFLHLADSDAPFVHLATEEQVPKIINKFFSDVPEVLVLKLDVRMLKGRLVKEKNPGGETEYYHLYEGMIPMNSVVGISFG